MVDQTVSPALPREKPEVVQVSAEEYMEHYAEHGYEWVKGVAIKMSPVSLVHENRVDFLRQLLNAYFALNPIGSVHGDRFVMEIESVGSKREPDLQVILKTNPGQLTETKMIGPADICIEVVSPGSDDDDYGDKFVEYEAGGVQEYWIIDPRRQETRFLRLQPTGLYKTIAPDPDGYYRTPLLPHFVLHLPTLWKDELPNIMEVVESVRAMFQQQADN